MNIKEATQRWVGEMNTLPQSLLEKAYPNMEGLEELTPVPKKYECEDCHEEFSLEEYDEVEEDHYGNKTCPSCLKDFKERDDLEEDEECESYIVEEDNYDEMEYGLPMWGWLWNPENIDEWWIKENLQEIADCGFRIYESDEVGIMIGIDGAGYDFYESHWIPLYKARGLKWHDKE